MCNLRTVDGLQFKQLNNYMTPESLINFKSDISSMPLGDLIKVTEDSVKINP